MILQRWSLRQPYEYLSFIGEPKFQFQGTKVLAHALRFTLNIGICFTLVIIVIPIYVNVEFLVYPLVNTISWVKRDFVVKLSKVRLSMFLIYVAVTLFKVGLNIFLILYFHMKLILVHDKIVKQFVSL